LKWQYKWNDGDKMRKTILALSKSSVVQTKLVLRLHLFILHSDLQMHNSQFIVQQIISQTCIHETLNNFTNVVYIEDFSLEMNLQNNLLHETICWTLRLDSLSQFF